MGPGETKLVGEYAKEEMRDNQTVQDSSMVFSPRCQRGFRGRDCKSSNCAGSMWYGAVTADKLENKL